MRNNVAVTTMVFAGILAFTAGCEGCGGDGGGSGSSSGGGSSSSTGGPPPPPPCPYTQCGANCVDTNYNENNCGACGNACGGGRICDQGVCILDTCNSGAGEAICYGECKNLLYDNNNCGECGYVCPAGETCQYAECHVPPAAGGSSSGTVSQ